MEAINPILTVLAKLLDTGVGQLVAGVLMLSLVASLFQVGHALVRLFRSQVAAKTPTLVDDKLADAFDEGLTKAEDEVKSRIPFLGSRK